MPVVTPVRPIMGRVLQEMFLGALSARPAAALLSTPLIGLFTAGPMPITPNAGQNSFTVCVFEGFALVPFVASTPITLPSGNGAGVIGPATFVKTDGPTSENVLGYFAYDDAGNMIVAEYFDAPIPMVNTGDFIDLQLFIPIANTVAI